MRNILLIAFVLLSCVLHGQWNGTAATGMFVTGNSVGPGTYSTAMGFGTTASGINSTAMGGFTTAEGFGSTAMGGSTTASGSGSTAMGESTTASGSGSTAMGDRTTASGNISTAMGSVTTASGFYSTAMGSSTTAEGFSSTAMGFLTTASGYGTLAIGASNTIDATANPTTFSTTNRAFVIGNGTLFTKSDAMTVLFDGTTTIAGSVSAPSFIGDGAQLTRVGRLGTITEGSNTGWRLIGRDPLNYGNIGNQAIDFSFSTVMSTEYGATGNYSVAMGERITASGDYSIAMGFGTTASGINSTAMGGFTTAEGFGSTAMGGSTTASGSGSTAMGESTTASGSGSTSMGDRTTASGNISTAMGSVTTASGFYSTAMGSSTTAEGFSSTAIGFLTTASGYGTLAIGASNTIDATATPTTFSTTNRAFVIGNGTLFTKSDAMTVLFDGTTTIAGDLTVNSDARLKSNISSLGNTLPMLKLLDGKTYNLKSNESKEKIGLLAQDVQKVFPQLVRSSKDDQATLSLNYQGLIPVLINAINEQQGMIEDYEARLNQQHKEMKSQQAQIGKLMSLVESLISDKQE